MIRALQKKLSPRNAFGRYTSSKWFGGNMPFIQDSPLVVSITTKILDIETNDGRFEGLCRSAVSILEGDAQILSTSASWDMGRDGVGFGKAEGIYVCASLRDDVDAKALSDLQRLALTTKRVKKVYFCSSHDLSEHRRDKIATQLENEVDHKFSIVVCGSRQLAEAAATKVEVLNRFYGPEIDDCLKILTEGEDQSADMRGLKLALVSLGEDSSSVREHIYRTVVLEILTHEGAVTVEGLSKRISDRLHLSRPLAKEALVAPLGQLLSERVINFDGRLYSATEEGCAEIARQAQDVPARLLNGRSLIRESIEKAIGSKLAEDHFNKIWNIFQDRIVSYFISRGETLVFEVSEIIGLDGELRKPQELRPFSFVDDLANALAQTSSSPQQQKEIEQAIKDIFLERTGPAAEWLVRVCMTFVAACTLGMEHSAGHAIAKVLRRTTLVLDTDVTMSLLGEGETDHDAVCAIVTRWRKLGGKVLVGEPVLEETAYHASIAQNDYEQVRRWLPGSTEERQQLITNVYVRSFAHLLALNEAKPQHWRAYLGQYLGSSDYDWTKVFRLLSTEYGIEKLPARSAAFAELEERVRSYLFESKQGSAITEASLRNARDKARRDAQLYAAIVSHIRYLRDMDMTSTCLLVSSARRLAIAESQFKEAAEPELVTSISTIVQLLTLVPDVSLGATAMRSFLFDERPTGFTTGFERTLVRMLHASEEVFVPWAKRGVLMNEVRGKLMHNAKLRGEKLSTDELERRALQEKNHEQTVHLIKEAFDAVALDTKTAKENAELRKRVSELEDKLRLQQSRDTRKRS
ncbi:hypothetical protein [Massilia sp. BKSP1R2A-1]|uniref:hypothetical protein n=1 Tax=Massilia sp. BKSP1R2A-1 TaxID=3422595 RepID=UPI003D34196A